MAAKAHYASVGINGFDIHAACTATWQVSRVSYQRVSQSQGSLAPLMTCRQLPGFEHHDGGYRVKLEVISNQYAFTQPYSQLPLQLQQKVTNQKSAEMREASIMKPAPHRKYSSVAVVAAIRRPDGQWTDKQFCSSVLVLRTM